MITFIYTSVFLTGIGSCTHNTGSRHWLVAQKTGLGHALLNVSPLTSNWHLLLSKRHNYDKAYALVPPLLYNFYLFCQRYWVFVDLRNPTSDMSTVDKKTHCCNCPCSVHPVGTHGFCIPVTSDRCIHFNIFIWQKRKKCSPAPFGCCAFAFISKLFLSYGYCPQYFISQDTNSLAEIISLFYMRAKRSHLESSTCTH